jgi:hypothetical protein
LPTVALEQEAKRGLGERSRGTSTFALQFSPERATVDNLHLACQPKLAEDRFATAGERRVEAPSGFEPEMEVLQSEKGDPDKSH